MIKSTILKFFEQPLYIVQAKLSGKVYIPCLNLTSRGKVYLIWQSQSQQINSYY
jgi:hypothetical protein